MRQTIVAVVLLVVVMSSAPFAAERPWRDEFAIVRSDLSSTGSNAYFILQPGYQLHFKSGDGELTITVLKETKTVDGVETRIVEERESENGKLVEVSRNYFAISKKDRSVYYFGEDVDDYDSSGKISGHGGSWHAGVNGARAGLMMPGAIRMGERFYQEVAPNVAMDRAEIVSASESMRTPAGKFDPVLKIEETTPLEPGAKEYKYYARGVGLLKDGDLLLVSSGYVSK